MTAADPQLNANTVREQIVKHPHSGASLNALDALQTQAETAEAALVDGQAAYVAMGLRAEAAEAERDRLEAAYVSAETQITELLAERDHARDALRQIATFHGKLGDIARAALGEDA